MAKEDFDRYLVGSLAYSYGTPDHIEKGETDANEIEWWRVVINRIHEMIKGGELRPPYKKFDHPLDNHNG